MPILQMGNLGLTEVESLDLRQSPIFRGLVGEAPKAVSSWGWALKKG